jgi:hypothetical protein
MPESKPNPWFNAMHRIADSKLSATDRHVLNMALLFADFWTLTKIRPSVSTLADRTGFDARTVQRSLSRLVNDGVLVVVTPGGAGHGRTTVYRLDPDAIPPREDHQDRPASAQAGTSKGGTESPLKGGTVSPLKGDTGARKGDSGASKGDTGARKGGTESPDLLRPAQTNSLPPQPHAADAAMVVVAEWNSHKVPNWRPASRRDARDLNNALVELERDRPADVGRAGGPMPLLLELIAGYAASAEAQRVRASLHSFLEDKITEGPEQWNHRLTTDRTPRPGTPSPAELTRAKYIDAHRQERERLATERREHGKPALVG